MIWFLDTWKQWTATCSRRTLLWWLYRKRTSCQWIASQPPGPALPWIEDATLWIRPPVTWTFSKGGNWSHSSIVLAGWMAGSGCFWLRTSNTGTSFVHPGCVLIVILSLGEKTLPLSLFEGHLTAAQTLPKSISRVKTNTVWESLDLLPKRWSYLSQRVASWMRRSNSSLLHINNRLLIVCLTSADLWINLSLWRITAENTMRHSDGKSTTAKRETSCANISTYLQPTEPLGKLYNFPDNCTTEDQRCSYVTTHWELLGWQRCAISPFH